MKFVSFHTHTTFSYADGFGTVEEHVKRVSSLGMRALGISEHGNVNSHAALEREANNAGIKPIFGIEAYVSGTGERKSQAKTHLTIFAMNQEGYHNLNKIVTQSYLDFYQWPTVSPTTLKKYNKGLVVFSGCSDSLISCSLLGGKFLGPRREASDGISWDAYEHTNRKLQWFCDVFDERRFFLEVQRFPRLDRTCALNEAFARFSKDTGIPLIATADVHYPFPSDNKMQAVLHAARWKNSPDLISETAWEYQANLSYPESDDEISTDLEATGLSSADAKQAIENTALLALRCNVELPKARSLRFPGVNIKSVIMCGDGSNVGDREKVANFAAVLTLTEKIREGFRRRVQQRPELKGKIREYNVRATQELKIIADKDFADYFLAVADLVTWAKANDITVGPGRGSAAGSLVCYVLGITEIDPMHPVFSRMIFERFIDPNRSDKPDIDLDFDDGLRYKIPERARAIYGPENVASVANHTGYKGKNTLNDICRAYGLPLSTFEEIRKRVPERTETDELLGNTIQDTVEAYRNHPKIARIIDDHMDKINQAIKLERNQHSMGIHACGFVVSSDPIPDVCAIYTKEKGQGRKREIAQVIPYEKRDAEYLNMLKMDFLGLAAMGQIGLVRRWCRITLDNLYSSFYKDYESGGSLNNRVLDLFRRDDVTGIFQYEGGTTRQVTRDVKPDNFDELAACNALSRPGPLYGGQTSEYIKVKNGEKDWERIHPTGFDRHVEWTYGQIVYQEQIMWILRDLAGFDTAKVLRVRKIIGKKLGEHQFAVLWEEFRNGCNANGVGEDVALRVWGAITTAAGYAFNTSHAYSYGLIAWWQGVEKLDQTTEFFASSLAKNGDGKDDLPRRTALLLDAIDHDILIDHEFDPDSMGTNWQPFYDEANVIVPGFTQIPDIADATASDIVEFKSRVNKKVQWRDLIGVKGVGEQTLLKMIEWSGQSDPFKIFHTSKQLASFRKQLENGEFDEAGLPDATTFVRSGELSSIEEDGWKAWVGFVANIHEKDELEIIRTKRGCTVEQAQEILAKQGAPEKSKKATVFAYDDTGETALRISRWTYDDLSEHLQAITKDHHLIVAYGRTFSERPNSIQVRQLWVFDPD